MDYTPKYYGGSLGFAVQTVIIHKPISISKAREYAKNILKKKRVSYREKDKTLHFRNLPKTKFIKGSFKSKKVNDSITLVFGQLKPEYMHLQGAGLWDWVKEKANNVVDYFKPRLDGYTNASTRVIKQYGEKPISSMRIVRTPIKSMINTVLNIVSLGKWQELKEKYSFDKLFHLGLVIEVENKMIVVEKNQTINISTKSIIDHDSEIMPVALGSTITLGQLLENTRKAVGDATFFGYDAFGNNCQNFIINLLQNNGLLNNENKSFVLQDITELSKELPGYVKHVAKAATDVAATIDKISGAGHKGTTMEAYVREQFNKL